MPFGTVEYGTFGGHVAARLLQQGRLEGLLAGGREVVFLEHPNAGVPAELGVVVVRRPEGFGPLVPVHRLPEPRVGDALRPGAAPVEGGAAATLADDPGVIVPFVVPRQ